MKPHLKAARGHIAFAVFYIVLGVFLFCIVPAGSDIAWTSVAGLAAVAVIHALLGWGAWLAKNWARVVTLCLAFPMLLMAPLGTLAAILLISYCWTAWDGQRPHTVRPT
jgi:hypothetical protein